MICRLTVTLVRPLDGCQFCGATQEAWLHGTFHQEWLYQLSISHSTRAEEEVGPLCGVMYGQKQLAGFSRTFRFSRTHLLHKFFFDSNTRTFLSLYSRFRDNNNMIISQTMMIFTKLMDPAFAQSIVNTPCKVGLRFISG